MQYLPLGSVVRLHKGQKNLMIIARGLMLQTETEQQYMDYASVLWPEGLMGDRLIYFQGGDIADIVFYGCQNPENEAYTTALSKTVAQFKAGKGNENGYDR